MVHVKGKLGLELSLPNWGRVNHPPVKPCSGVRPGKFASNFAGVLNLGVTGILASEIPVECTTITECYLIIINQKLDYRNCIWVIDI